MKTKFFFRVLGTVGCILLLWTGSVFAAPIILKFQGTVTSIINNSENLDLSGITLGMSVEYVFQVDFDGTGYTVNWDGEREDRVSGSYSGYSYSPFFSQMLSAMLLEGRAEMYLGNRGSWAESFHGHNASLSNGDNQSALISGSENEQFFITATNNTDDWVVGMDDFTVRETIYDLSGNTAMVILENVELVAMYAPVETPIPGSIFAMAAGLTGLVFFRKRSLRII